MNFNNLSISKNLLMSLETLSVYKPYKRNTLMYQALKEEIVINLKDLGINIDGVACNPLSFNERICLVLAFLGEKRKRIAGVLGINLQSVKTYYRRIFYKLKAKNIQEAIWVAFSKKYFSFTTDFLYMSHSE